MGYKFINIKNENTIYLPIEQDKQLFKFGPEQVPHVGSQLMQLFEAFIN